MIRIIRELSLSLELKYLEFETKIVPRETILKLRAWAYKNRLDKEKQSTHKEKKIYTKKKIRLCNQTKKTRQTFLHVQKK